MYIKVRTIDLKKNVTVLVSKTSKINELKEKIEEALKVKPEKQRLFYRGKQLEDGYTIFDYDINLNDVVQLMIKTEILEASRAEDIDSTKPQKSKEVTSKYLKIGDFVDVLDRSYGAWFEGKVVLIKANCEGKVEESESDDCLLYGVQLEGEERREMVCIERIGNIRPRSCYVYKYEELKVGDKVLVNYNVEKPEARGYWYDFEITHLSSRKHANKLIGTLLIGGDRVPLQNIKVKYCDEVMKIEKLQKSGENTANEPNNVTGEVSGNSRPGAEEKNGPECEYCNDNARRKCKFCGCYVCGGKNDPDKLILCDECDQAYHLGCLKPPLESVPEHDDWYCPECKNDTSEIVHAGEKLKASKRKAQMASKKQGGSGRDWGKGFACVGRTKVCTIVPPDHFGPIPGIPVGSSWKFRLCVSEAGVHRPHVAGIHGREHHGAYSIVLSGGYEDDVDSGETFLYTGSGGRDLSGNKRTAGQSRDQILTRMNRALALNCAAPLNEKGAKAKDWRAGKPIRVIRSYKLRKHSAYAPEEGCRYDGIYKVVEYFPEKGLSGFSVWRYKLRRDDECPAPWTVEGKKKIEKLGLTMTYPEGYFEAELEKQKNKTTVKRQLEISTSEMPPKKLAKMDTYKLKKEQRALIAADKANEKLWLSCRNVVKDGKLKFLQSVSDNFMCICCQELVHNPVTTKCSHNFCSNCLQRSFNAQVYSCPVCRATLSCETRLKVNENLRKALVNLFPGYEAGR